jgi:DNA mismatch endonuclease (patch repair protein)
MPDFMTAAGRSALMAKIRGKNTGPELIVRRLLHRGGYRYRLHRRDLPGCPDIVFPARRKVVFVHGCFWHGHAGCAKAMIPKTRREYWLDKIERNKERDAFNSSKLNAAGWETLTVWQCELRDMPRLGERLIAFLEDVKRQKGAAPAECDSIIAWSDGGRKPLAIDGQILIG